MLQSLEKNQKLFYEASLVSRGEGSGGKCQRAKTSPTPKDRSFLFLIFIYLAASGLNCGKKDLTCIMQDL